MTNDLFLSEERNSFKMC